MQTHEEKILAYLHDTIEDTRITINMLILIDFHIDILRAMISITKGKDEEYQSYIARVSKNELATKVKIADLEDNMNPDRWHFGNRYENDSMWKRYTEAHKTLTQSRQKG